ncbi:hypothetical protein SY83_05345 [Paenibacillus swuensis]|uniref:IclR family transcriptional regulator n=1 Tax=Paenibacillus swuensis TaxID=1178515 RepID=A0A172TFI7_9BACL|nr:IclR family transcriptional regulator [Paenibacillus swuensis]ANE45818.1 hypothetical protein SY83_05345 [Paenibacillus swuensis]
MDKTSTDKASTKYNVPALNKALLIIETLAEQADPMGVSDLCKLLEIPKTSAFFILNTLESQSYIRKTEDGKYALGTKFLTISASILNKMDIRELARPFMRELRDSSHYTVHLAVLDHGEALYIEKQENEGFVKFSTYIGQRQLLHISGVGKALAAYLPLPLLDSILDEKGLPRRTDHTITNPDEFKKALVTIRSQGYAIEDEEGELGVRCLAAPIFDAQQQLRAAISITALRNDLGVQQIPMIGELVRKTALQISQALGYTDTEFPINIPE